MVRVKLAYGRSDLDVDLPDWTDVIAPRFVDGLPDEQAALRDEAGDAARPDASWSRSGVEIARAGAEEGAGKDRKAGDGGCLVAVPVSSPSPVDVKGWISTV